jgi:hypothetical protein
LSTTDLNPDELLRAKLVGETAKISWPELQRYYARGAVIRVAGELDLVEVAFQITRDDQRAVGLWAQSGLLRRASDDDARDWHERDPVLWAVVVVPWVLVQERAQASA